MEILWLIWAAVMLGLFIYILICFYLINLENKGCRCFMYRFTNYEIDCPIKQHRINFNLLKFKNVNDTELICNLTHKTEEIRIASKKLINKRNCKKITGRLKG